ncbi:MAG: HEPN domain-containing protein [Thermofilaceae archaeon]|uniref:HEPN domain-containing protein n=1 Tax=Pyrobaculum sp. TaxID=2004705 RepID=UPI003165D944
MSTPQVLLERAEEDLESAEILYCRKRTRRNSLYHIEQALEKTLKAIIMGVLLELLESIIEVAEKLGIANQHREVHQFLKQEVKNYKKPVKLGHDLRGFADTFLPGLYEKFCTSRLIAYLKDVYEKFAHQMRQNKQILVAHLKHQGLDGQRAENALELLATLFEKTASFIKNNVKGPLCSQTFINLKYVHEQIKKNTKTLSQRCKQFNKRPRKSDWAKIRKRI